MNELQVQTIEKTPAKIDFNFEELSNILDEQLKKYEGLEFTEADVKECKKTITELNKGKKALNDYRLQTKKELSIEINDFEAKCKHLSNKFDDVIKPLKEQSDAFEENRKDEKRKQVQEIVDELIENEGLNDKYAFELIVEDSYLNKSTTMKSIREDLGAKAEHLGIQQDTDNSNRQLIESHVELINLKYDVELDAESYYRLLEFDSVEDIKEQIESLAKKKVEARSVEEQEKKEEAVEQQEEQKEEELAPIKKEATYVENYEVFGTESQLDALEEYMSSHNLEWSVVK